MGVMHCTHTAWPCSCLLLMQVAMQLAAALAGPMQVIMQLAAAHAAGHAAACCVVACNTVAAFQLHGQADGPKPAGPRSRCRPPRM